MRTLALHLYSFVSYAQVRGIPLEEILLDINNKPVDFSDETATVNSDDFYRALTRITKWLPADRLGLQVGAYLNLNALGLVYQISLQTTTIEEGLFYLKNFMNATFPIIVIHTFSNKESAVIELKIENKELELNRIILESTLTVIAREIRMMAGEELEIYLFSPFYTSNYPALWSKGEVFSITFKPTILKAAIKDQSRLHLDVLIPEYLKLIERIKSEKSFATQVKIASLNMAKPELPDLESVAGMFNLTPRTFQRRLSTENITFRQITDELKKQISNLLIRHNRFSVADVSYVLGYAEPAAFIHSFKKWYGHSPDKIRQQFIKR